MKLLFITALLFSSFSVFANGERVRLAKLTLNENVLVQTCRDSGLKFRGIDLKLKKGVARLNEIEITFGNGSQRRIYLGRVLATEGYRSQAFMFTNARCIKSIMVRGVHTTSIYTKLVVRGLEAQRNRRHDPPRRGGRLNDFRSGMRVYNKTKSAFATIIARDIHGKFVLRFTSGTLSGRTGSGWASSDLAFLEGCTSRLCVGDNVYNTTKSAYVRVIGYDLNGRYVLRFTSGSLNGRVGHNWSNSDLAILHGSNGIYSVGESAYNITKSAFVKVVGVQENGRLVLNFTSGTLNGRTGHNWSNSDLAKLSGCGRAYCVGDRAYNVTKSAYVVVVGIQSNGRYVLKFTSGTLNGRVGHNWSDSDLARLR